MTNLEIEQRLEERIQAERRITKEILELIIDSEERKIYAERGYPNMFSWLTKRFGYSEPAANRRLSAARLLRSLPDAKTKIENGKLNLTTMAKAQSIIRAQEKASKKKVSAEEKASALNQIENKSLVKAEQALLSPFPEAASTVRQERVTALTEDTLRLNANIPNEVMSRFEKVRDLLSHQLPRATFIEVADFLFKKLLKEEAEKDAAAAKQRVKDKNTTMTKKTRRIVLKKSDGRCIYKDPVTGKVCGGTYQVQVDHRTPKALGGGHDAFNLRGLCGTHNRLMAEKILGRGRVNRWRNQRGEI